MLSVENFYYILYQHLLEPLGLQDIAHWHFGSVDAKDITWGGRYSQNKNLYGKPYVNVNSCYFYDQEPVQKSSFLDLIAWSTTKHCKILVNSEFSDLKDTLCQEHQCQDWYYFFHGFAALDWYRDAQYFKQNQAWDRAYISLNRLHVNDRSYRLNLIARLADKQILSQGHVSLHLGLDQYGNWLTEINNPDTKLSKQACDLILQHISQPLLLDQENVSAAASADFGHQEFDLWNSGLWHIVTETVFYHNKLHLTEKTFKPIVAQRPFMLAAAPGNLAYLKSYGFKTFDRWVDESYDTIQDPDQRLQAVVDQTRRLCSMSRTDLRAMQQEMQPVLEHNFNHFYGDFKKRIVNELVDNFETAVRQWNNGRVDGRQLPLHKINLNQVKNILQG